MNNETQNLIVCILGLYAILSLIGIIILSLFSGQNEQLILALIPVTIAPITTLGGFIAGKTMTEKQQEDYEAQTNNKETTTEEAA